MSNDPYANIVTRVYRHANLKAKQRLAGGVSADVYRLDLDLADGSTTSLVLRAHGASHSGHSAKLEYKLLQALHRLGVPVPEPLLLDVSGSLLTVPFILMEFVGGTSIVTASRLGQQIDVMAYALSKIHALPSTHLPRLPARINPLPKVLDYLPDDREWDELRIHLCSLTDTEYVGAPILLHGDFWPENLLWRNGKVVAILDWEDAAFGDPMSDLATCRIELRYKFGVASMQLFTQAYARYRPVDRERLALWQVYAAAAAQRFMSEWDLPHSLEVHMRTEALECIREAGEMIMGKTDE